MELDYKQICGSLLATLTLRELSALCNIICKDINIKTIHENIKKSLDPKDAVDPEFCIKLQKKVDTKQFALLDLINLSHAIIDRKFSLFEYTESQP